LVEYVASELVLVETSRVSLEEAQSLAGEFLTVSEVRTRPRVRGIFSIAETKNQNGRYYSWDLLERERIKVLARAKRGSGMMNVDHPLPNMDVKTDEGVKKVAVPQIRDVAAILEDLWWEGKELWGVAILCRSFWGSHILSILEAGGRPGVSSRGYGATEKKEIAPHGVVANVQDNYYLDIFDFVLNPSEVAAGVELDEVLTQEITERECITLRERGQEECIMKNLKELQEKYPDLCAELLKENAATLRTSILEAELPKAVQAEVDTIVRRANSGEVLEGMQKQTLQLIVEGLKDMTVEAKNPFAKKEAEEEEEVKDSTAPSAATVMETASSKEIKRRLFLAENENVALKESLGKIASDLASQKVETHVNRVLADVTEATVRSFVSEQIKFAAPKTIDEANAVIQRSLAAAKSLQSAAPVVESTKSGAGFSHLLETRGSLFGGDDSIEESQAYKDWEARMNPGTVKNGSKATEGN